VTIPDYMNPELGRRLLAGRSVGNRPAVVKCGGSCAGVSISLGKVVEHTPVLIVACTRCGARAGRYNLETLIARHGEDYGIPDRLRRLSKRVVGDKRSIDALSKTLHDSEMPAKAPITDSGGLG
jgi:hypothetical protein